MHIEFKRITLHNFMSFGDAELSFNDAGFIRVTGINENPLDNASSNGSGKSSLWEAIIWAITGETIRGTKQIVSMYGEDGCFVDIEFTIDNKQYKLIRSKEHKVYKTNLQIFIDGKDVSGKGIRDSEKLLQDYLPDITASLLGSVIILGQGLPQRFTSNTPSGRKEVLEKLSKSDFMIEDLKHRVTDRKNELTKIIRQYEDTLLKCDSEATVLQAQISAAEEDLLNLDKDSLIIELDTATSELNKINNNISQNNSELESVSSRYQEWSNELAAISESEFLKLTEAQKTHEEMLLPFIEEQKTLNIELSSASRELTKLQNIKDICPTCGQKLPNVHKPDTASIETHIDDLKTRLDSVNDKIRQNTAEYNTQRAHIQSQFTNHKDTVKHNIQDALEWSNRCKSTLRILEQDSIKYTQKIQELEVKLAQIDATIDTNNKIIINNNEKLHDIADKIMYNNAQKDLTQSHLEVINKFDTALKRDFRGYLLSTVIAFIEQRAKYYSKIIFDTDYISFCLDGNNIDISYMDRAYENLSSGEKQKIDLIIQFSIRDMLSAHLRFTSNILVLDEIFDGLDSLGCTKVIDMIASVSDIKNIFIVTHRKDLSIPSDKELIVVKSSVGISEIRT